MELSSFISFLQSILFLLVTFGVLVLFGIVRGRRAQTNLILGLYLALLISLVFPYTDSLISTMGGGEGSGSMIRILIFGAFTLAATFLFDKLLFHRPDEAPLQGLPKKIILAALGTILVLSFSYHVLPVTEFIDPGVSIGNLFAPKEYFFWWILVPLIGLFILY